MCWRKQWRGAVEVPKKCSVTNRKAAANDSRNAGKGQNSRKMTQTMVNANAENTPPLMPQLVAQCG